MENQTSKLTKAGILFIVTLLIVSSVTVMASTSAKAPFSSMTKMVALSDSSKGETELKYYEEEGLSTVIGVCSNACWKSAIRLTQMEMAPYMNWIMTKVNVAFSADNGCPYIDARIYIFDEGDETHPGSIIVNDTVVPLNTTGVHTIPLVTTVNLSNHNELWVAVEWRDNFSLDYYAWLDTITLNRLLFTLFINEKPIGYVAATRAAQDSVPVFCFSIIFFTQFFKIVLTPPTYIWHSSLLVNTNHIVCLKFFGWNQQLKPDYVKKVLRICF